mmetsp:Transcript_9075/g.22774  ORF Transcript_9075/g.22774 Transcript_9075/m.22774 type:complete len:201 (+) Transcript_9075:242-844(+)
MWTSGLPCWPAAVRLQKNQRKRRSRRSRLRARCARARQRTTCWTSPLQHCARRCSRALPMRWSSVWWGGWPPRAWRSCLLSAGPCFLPPWTPPSAACVRGRHGRQTTRPSCPLPACCAGWLPLPALRSRGQCTWCPWPRWTRQRATWCCACASRTRTTCGDTEGGGPTLRQCKVTCAWAGRRDMGTRPGRAWCAPCAPRC